MSYTQFLQETLKVKVKEYTTYTCILYLVFQIENTKPKGILKTSCSVFMKPVSVSKTDNFIHQEGSQRIKLFNFIS